MRRLPSRYITAAALLFIILMAWSCEKRPKNVLSEDETIELLADLQLAEAYSSVPSAQGHAGNNLNLQESVLAAHGVTQEEFDATLAYYGRNIDDYYKLYDKVEKRLKKRGEKVSNKGIETEGSADDLWPYSQFAYISKASTTNGFKFSIGGENLTPGERVEWKVRLTSNDMVEGVLGFEYNDGSISYSKRSSSGNKNLNIILQSDTIKPIKRIYGYITVPQRTLPVWADSIQLLKHPYLEEEYSKIRLQQNMSRPGKKPAEVPKVENTEKKDSI